MASYGPVGAIGVGQRHRCLVIPHCCELAGQHVCVKNAGIWRFGTCVVRRSDHLGHPPPVPIKEAVYRAEVEFL